MVQIYDKIFTSAWDTQFLFALLINSGMCIIPNVNLVSHIRFVGTHAAGNDYYEINKNSSNGRPVEEMKFPLKHPEIVVCDRKSDKELLKRHNGINKTAHIKLKLKMIKYQILSN